MLNSDFDLKKFNSVQNEMSFILKCKVRFGILNRLHASPLTKKELKSSSGYSYTVVNSNLNQLKDCGYVLEDDGLFSLSDEFNIVFDNLLNLKRSVDFIEKNKTFLNDHQIFNMGYHALIDIFPLSDMELIVNDNDDIFRVCRLIKNFFTQSGTIKSVFPYLPPRFDEELECWINNNADVNLILSKSVFRSFKNFICDLGFNCGGGNFSLDMEIADPFLDVLLAVSDNGMLLGFYKNDGDFDRNAIFHSSNRRAIEWALKLFSMNWNSCEEHILSEDFAAFK